MGTDNSHNNIKSNQPYAYGNPCVDLIEIQGDSMVVYADTGHKERYDLSAESGRLSMEKWRNRLSQSGYGPGDCDMILDGMEMATDGFFSKEVSFTFPQGYFDESSFRDYRFQDANHKKNFLDNMFVVNEIQKRKHSTELFFTYVNRKCFVNRGYAGLGQRKMALKILKDNEICLDRYVHKAFLFYVKMDAEAMFAMEDFFGFICGSIQQAADGLPNVRNVCAVFHIAQKSVNEVGKSQPPHIHVFYESEQDVVDELPMAAYKMLTE